MRRSALVLLSTFMLGLVTIDWTGQAVDRLDDSTPTVTLEIDFTDAWDADDPAALYPPCATEDAPGPCHWDASKRGNGAGQSFYVIDGVVTHL